MTDPRETSSNSRFAMPLWAKPPGLPLPVPLAPKGVGDSIHRQVGDLPHICHICQNEDIGETWGLFDIPQYHSYCVSVKNITVSVDDQVYHDARVAAAQKGTSVSAVVREALVRYTKGHAPAPLAAAAEHKQRLRLVKLLEQCQIDLTERPTREATYAHRRVH
jgi:plasmid stability protein